MLAMQRVLSISCLLFFSTNTVNVSCLSRLLNGYWFQPLQIPALLELRRYLRSHWVNLFEFRYDGLICHFFLLQQTHVSYCCEYLRPWTLGNPLESQITRSLRYCTTFPSNYFPEIFKIFHFLFWFQSSHKIHCLCFSHFLFDDSRLSICTFNCPVLGCWLSSPCI